MERKGTINPKRASSFTLLILALCLASTLSHSSGDPIPKQRKFTPSEILELEERFKITSCSFNQTHITLGDAYSNSSSEHQFTITTVAMGPCDAPVLLLDNDNPTKPSYTKPYQFAYSEPQISFYKRTVYFWYISKTTAANHDTWALATGTAQKFENFTQAFKFPPRAQDHEKIIKVAVIADMDITPTAYPTMNELGSFGGDRLDMVIHAGDMAYDIHFDNGLLGDYFYNNMSAITTKVPYFVVAGNHEYVDTTKFFGYRFRMPGTNVKDNDGVKWYSYDYKNTHFSFLDFDHIMNYRPDRMNEGFLWLWNDLEQASKNENIKWIVFIVHRPFYCNDVVYTSDCTRNFFNFRRFEALVRKFHVDLTIHGHVHLYSRLKLLKNFMPFDYPKDNKPGLPVMIIAGHSGTKHFFASPKMNPIYTYPITQVVNNAHASWLEIDISEDQIEVKTWNSGLNTTADSLVILKEDIPQGDEGTKLIYLIIVVVVVVVCAVLALITIIFMRGKGMDGDGVGVKDNVSDGGSVDAEEYAIAREISDGGASDRDSRNQSMELDLEDDNDQI